MKSKLIQELEEDFNYLADNYDNIIKNGEYTFFDIKKANPVLFTQEYIKLSCFCSVYNQNQLDQYMEKETYYEVWDYYLQSEMLVYLRITENFEYIFIKELNSNSQDMMENDHFDLDKDDFIRIITHNSSCSTKLLHELEKHSTYPNWKNDYINKLQKMIKNHKNYKPMATMVLDVLKSS